VPYITTIRAAIATAYAIFRASDMDVVSLRGYHKGASNQT